MISHTTDADGNPLLVVAVARPEVAAQDTPTLDAPGTAAPTPDAPRRVRIEGEVVAVGLVTDDARGSRLAVVVWLPPDSVVPEGATVLLEVARPRGRG